VKGGTAFVNAVSSSFPSSPPLSFISHGLEKLFELRAYEDNLELQEQMVKTSKQVQTLQINNQDILHTVNNIKTLINKFETLKGNSYMSMTALNIEIALKVMARHIQMLLTATLNNGQTYL
jgi:hypothetical protein